MIPKFRAWDKEKKTMWNIERWHIEDEYFDLIEPNKSVVDLNAKRTWRKQRDVILMQSTGMFDKNGVEIFERDVVIAWSQGVKGTFEIKRRIDGLWLLCPAWKDGNFWYLSPTEDGCETIEIIGDIYRNPELVEG